MVLNANSGPNQYFLEMFPLHYEMAFTVVHMYISDNLANFKYLFQDSKQ